ncbi:hypothetical protein QQF64_001136 [Cirrhinus molitorella]|uniref:Reverse transcriptase/retrotransposon-derived protein RNase H-like domain-containing protein n=1 Tax=Cirrhinus molitorella TaxID=172907 RepID=A0ABR3NZ54_9TELE
MLEVTEASHGFTVRFRRVFGRLRRVLTELCRAGLTAKPRKCHLALAEAQYLGFQVGRGLIRPQQGKVEAILNAPFPRTKTQMRDKLEKFRNLENLKQAKQILHVNLLREYKDRRLESKDHETIMGQAVDEEEDEGEMEPVRPSEQEAPVLHSKLTTYQQQQLTEVHPTPIRQKPYRVPEKMVDKLKTDDVGDGNSGTIPDPTMECEKAFIALKEMLCKEPILQNPDFSKRFPVQLDASEAGLGAVLAQGEVGNE